jgi:hypothetical protein
LDREPTAWGSILWPIGILLIPIFLLYSLFKGIASIFELATSAKVYEGLNVEYNYRIYRVLHATLLGRLTLKDLETGEIIEGVSEHAVDIADLIKVIELEVKMKVAAEQAIKGEDEDDSDAWLFQ